MRSRAEAAAPLAHLLRQQLGLLTRAQALEHGMSPATLEHRVQAGRWRRVSRGVYATVTGALTFRQRVWGAVLGCGPGAVASHRAAALLDRLLDLDEHDQHGLIDVTVPRSRRVVPPAGVRVHYSDHASARQHPARLPPRTTLEDTVLDLWEQTKQLDRALAVVAAACQRRLTSPGRLLDAAARRKKLRRRALFLACLSDVAAGAHSLLELVYLRDVERAHGLPTGQRQRQLVRRRKHYTDVEYIRFASHVELDGRLWHPDPQHDRRRDNATVLAGRTQLRYGWPEVTAAPCHVATEVAELLQANGWSGSAYPCGSRCAVGRC